MMKFGKFLKPFQNSKYCGDQCGYWVDQDCVTLCMIDGLGHGQDAEIAAKAALNYVEQNHKKPLADLFEGCDQAISNTRGVAMGLARICQKSLQIEYSAVGNTRACIFAMSETYLGGNYGIIGNGLENPPAPETLSISVNHTFGFWTDGLPDTLNLRQRLKSYRGDLNELCKEVVEEFALEDDCGLMLFKLR